MIKLIATDMDGTLLDSNKRLPEEIFEIIDALAAQGVHFVVSSGRQYYTLAEQFAPVADELSFIAENGAMVVDRGETVFLDSMEPDVVKTLIDAARTVKGGHVVVCGARAAYVESTAPIFLNNVQPYYARFEIVPDVQAVAAADRICKVAVFSEGHAETDAYPFLKPYGDGLAVCLSGPRWVDMMNKTVNKGAAIRFLRQRFGISREECMAFGDYLNDTEMMKECAFSYAMENAHPDLKAVSRFQCPSNDERGVITTIEKNVLKEG